MNYRVQNENILISIAPGEKINENLEKVANKENIESASISGIGAITEIEIGFYFPGKQDYGRKVFNGDFELTSLQGNISMKEGLQFAHTHITFCGPDYTVFGGHLFEAKVSVAGEFLMTRFKKSLYRKFNDDAGLALWCIDNE